MSSDAVDPSQQAREVAQAEPTDQADQPAPAAAAASAGKAGAWSRRALPFVVAAALVAFTLSRIDTHAFAEHLAAVNAPAFLLFSCGWVFALLTADAFGTATVYRRTVAPVTFREMWVLRGASYLPAILNHHVGQAVLTYYMSRRYAVSLARMAGGTLVVYASWAGCFVGAGAIAMIGTGERSRPALLLGAGVLYLAVIAWRPARLARVKLLAPLFEAGLAGHFVALLVRVPHFLVLFLGTWLPFSFFGVDIPFTQALVYVPIVMVAVTLPITPQGVGTRDLVALWAFARFAPGDTPAAQAAAITAATASFAVAFTLVEVVLGVVLMRWAMPSTERRAGDA